MKDDKAVSRGQRGSMAFKANAAALMCSVLALTPAQAEDCGRDALTAVVGEARAELTAMNQSNKQDFHEKLQRLKAQAGWSGDEYVAKATPFVRDEQIAAFNAEHEQLIARVPQIGKTSRSVASLAGTAPGFSASSDKGCAMAEKLRTLMDDVVANSRAKWRYMLGKVDAALDAAKAAQ